MYNVKTPSIDGANKLMNHTIKLAAIIEVFSTLLPNTEKIANAENSLTPKSARKLNDGTIDFRKKTNITADAMSIAPTLTSKI